MVFYPFRLTHEKSQIDWLGILSLQRSRRNKDAYRVYVQAHHEREFVCEVSINHGNEPDLSDFIWQWLQDHDYASSWDKLLPDIPDLLSLTLKDYETSLKRDGVKLRIG